MNVYRLRTSFYGYFDETVAQCGSRVAVVEGDSSITFSSLHQRETLLSRKITQLVKGVVACPIAVFIPKSIDVITADLAILHTGNAYMNLDVKLPAERFHNILSKTVPRLIITNAKWLPTLTALGAIDVPVWVMDEHAEVDAGVSSVQNDGWRKVIDTDPLCIINTSGSTGTPKGVVLNHRSFFDFMDCAIETWKLEHLETMGSLSPSIFDIFSFELSMLIQKGTTLVLIPEMWAMFPVKILELLERHQVSFIFWVPTIMVNIANLGILEKIPPKTLRMIWFAGEVFPTKQFNQWRKALPQARFVNLYGPIEITLDCTWYEVIREISDDEPLPIGFPCRNTEVMILTADNQLAQEGEEGELCVRGSSLAMGYYNNSEKTSEAFVQNPLNQLYPELIYRTGDIAYRNQQGEIIFRGRKDSMIKHSGYRIELGEIEHVVINTLKLFQNACVVYHHARKEITLIYEAEKEVDIAMTRKTMATVFTKYMIPTVFIRMDALPRGGTGKVDRALLNRLVNEDNISSGGGNSKPIIRFIKPSFQNEWRVA
ncbi:MAG: amino acid adenylation domain-containing protein [Kiritimatiellia bacterium]